MLDPTVLTTTGAFATSEPLAFKQSFRDQPVRSIDELNKVIEFMDEEYQISFGPDPVSELEFK